MTSKSLLAAYRRTVAESYARVRNNPHHAQACQIFREERDHLFLNHPLSPVYDQRENYGGVPYAEYDPAWRLIASIDYDVEQKIYELDLPEGHFQYQTFGHVEFTAPTGQQGSLNLFWILGYGGGVFVPFGDTTNKVTTYGGGRYLYDTIKGADLGISEDEIILDFNFAYHPSCRYSPQWTCPLAPMENRLEFDVPVGELLE